MDIPLVSPVLPSVYPATAPQPAVYSAAPAPSLVQVRSDEMDTGTKVLLGLLGVGVVGAGIYVVKKRFDAITAATVKATSDVSTAAAAVQAAAPSAPAPTPAPAPVHAKKKHVTSSTPATTPKPASTAAAASLPGLSSSGGLLGS